MSRDVLLLSVRCSARRFRHAACLTAAVEPGATAAAVPGAAARVARWCWGVAAHGFMCTLEPCGRVRSFGTDPILTLEVPEPEEGREGRARVASYTVKAGLAPCPRVRRSCVTSVGWESCYKANTTKHCLGSARFPDSNIRNCRCKPTGRTLWRSYLRRGVVVAVRRQHAP